MIKLNLARNCLRYLVRACGISEMFIPYYSCSSVRHALRLEGCRLRFYHIGRDFLPTKELPEESFVLYINYFGMCDNNCKRLAKIYPNLIVDNTHAFYSEPCGFASFNSLRKFFPVQNGAYLNTPKILNEHFEQDTVLFTPVSIQTDYDRFVKNELILDKEGIKYISPEVEEYFSTFDFERDKQLRLERFWEYHNRYEKYNLIKLTPSDGEIPYCYPLSTSDRSILDELSKKTTLLRLWEELPQDFPEYGFLNNTVALFG